MVLLAEIIYYVGVVIVAFLLFVLLLSIGFTIVDSIIGKKNPEKKIQIDDGTSYTDETSDYDRKRQWMQQQQQWQQESANRVAQDAMQQAQESAHNAMVTAERDHAMANDMFQIGNTMYEDAYSMGCSVHDSFNDNSFSAPSFDCGSFGGNPFF